MTVLDFEVMKGVIKFKLHICNEKVRLCRGVCLGPQHCLEAQPGSKGRVWTRVHVMDGKVRRHSAFKDAFKVNCSLLTC